MARIQFVHNPASGSFDQKLYSELMNAATALGHESVSSVSSPDHHFQLVNGVDHVCVAGGDGTVRHVAACLAEEPSPPGISVYPMGTINLAAREIDWPAKPIDFVRWIAQESGRAHLWPTLIDQDYFIVCASIGPDSHAVARVSTKLKAVIGRFAYGVSMIKALLFWLPPALTVTTDSGSFECEALYVAKGRYFAGPWSFAPDARLDQPGLHVVALPSASRFAYSRFLLALALGRTDRLPGLRRMTVAWLTVECPTAQPVQIDGDIGCTTPVTIKLAARPLLA